MLGASSTLVLAALLAAPHPHAAEGVTSLTNKAVVYRVAKEHFVKIQRGPLTAVFVDNNAVDVPDLPKHRAGYNGLASLTHTQRSENLFVPGIAGLNYEHIHDGTLAVAQEKFEPRKAPMELRIIDEFTVELYQPPTHNWKLESCGRYRVLEDGTIEYTFECIPRAELFKNNTIGLFWASYIHAPQDRAIYFQGRKKGTQAKPAWIKGVTPSHGVDSTHPPAGYPHKIDVDPQFPLTLVNHPSPYEYTTPWYYGVSHNMAYAQLFRPRDQIWLAQSPTGGGRTNPAWDFQWFIPNCKVDQAYGFTMRAVYVPFEGREKLERVVAGHRRGLAGQ